MSLEAALDALLGIQPVPGLSLAFHTLRFIVNCIQQVSESRRQLEELGKSVVQLLAALNAEFTAARLVESTSAAVLRDLDSLLKDVQKFVQKEQERGFFKALLHQDARISGVEGFYRRIGTIVNSFQESTSSVISALWNVQTALANDRRARKDDADTLNKRLKNLERNQAELRRILDVNQGNVMAMMVSIERKLANQRVERMSAVEQAFYSHAMQYLSVLSGQQVKVEDWMITPYEVDFGKEVGSGGFGRVYRGTWNRTDVAIKVVRNVAGVTPRAEVLRREIEIWSRLRHPNILQFLGANTLDEQPFIVMPYIPNTAREFLHKEQEFDPVYILRDVSLGLEYLHSRTICHGDLKGVNVLVDHSNRALLCDFGLARVKADVTSRTVGMPANGPTIFGSRNWMAPELFTGAPPSTRSDMYAFGMTVYELYADEDPLCHIRSHDFVELVCQRDLRPSRPTKIARLTDSMWDLATSCWAKRSSDRPTARKVHDVISHGHLITDVKNIGEARTRVKSTVPRVPNIAQEPTAQFPTRDVQLRRASSPDPQRRRPLSRRTSFTDESGSRSSWDSSLPRTPIVIMPSTPKSHGIPIARAPLPQSSPPEYHRMPMTIIINPPPQPSAPKSHVLRLTSNFHYIRFVPIKGPIPFNGSFTHTPVICKLAEGLIPISFGRTKMYTSDLTGITRRVTQNQQNMDDDARYRKEILPAQAHICVVPGPRFLIRHNGSSEGTYLNGAPLSTLSLARELHSGDRVQFGCGADCMIMLVEFQQPAPPQSTNTDLSGPLQPPLVQKTQDLQNAPRASMESRLQKSIFLQLIENIAPNSAPSSSAKPTFGSILCRIVEDAESLPIRRWDPADTGAADGIFFESPTISRDHARLRYYSGALCIRDSNSRNGTFLNWRSLGGQGWTRIMDKDVLEFQDPTERRKGRQGVLVTVKTWEVDFVS